MALQEIIPYLKDSGQTHFAAGQTIFNAGDIGFGMYFIVEGEVHISLQGRALDHLAAGQVFGEMALVDDQVRSATATAATDCVLAHIDKTRFTILTQQRPSFAAELMVIMSTRLRRFIEVEVKRQRLEQELAIGQQIQLSLLPESCPFRSGWDFAAVYRAARQVGGDLYDFISDPEQPDLLHMVIADVTGKGVPAAMFMALCRTVIRTEARNGRSPAELLRRTNQFLVSEQRSRTFLTAFFATLNIQTGELRYAIGGHDRPYWLQAGNGRLQQLTGQGMLLGAFPTIRVEENTITLAPGDTLILYTDGITEARRGPDLFDEAGLEAVIIAQAGATAQQLSQKVLEAVDQFSGDTPQSDDITLVILKRWG